MAQAIAEDPQQAARLVLRRRHRAPGLTDEADRLLQRPLRRVPLAQHLLEEELDRRRGRPRRDPRGHDFAAIGFRGQDRPDQIGAVEPIEGLVDLEDEGEAAALEPLEHPALPERPGAIEARGRDAGHGVAELIGVPGLRERRVSQVEVEVELGIVDPDRMALDRNPAQLLAQSRQLRKSRCDDLADAREIDAALRRAQGARLEDQDHPRMGTPARGLDREGGRALFVEPFVVDARHSLAPVGAALGSGLERRARRRPRPPRPRARRARGRSRGPSRTAPRRVRRGARPRSAAGRASGSASSTPSRGPTRATRSAADPNAARAHAPGPGGRPDPRRPRR